MTTPANAPGDWEDRLIDQLLKEELGQESPPDLTERILAAARKESRRSRVLSNAVPRSQTKSWGRPWVAVVVTLAAAILVTIGTVLFWPRPRPTNTLDMVGLSVDGGKLARGSIVRSADQPGELRLGGYCEVQLQPRSVVQIEGVVGKERLKLLEGVLQCAVQSKRGSFVVDTPQAVVLVTGTQFEVRRLANASGDATQVSVQEGQVLVTCQGVETAVRAGEQIRFPLPTEAFARRVALVPPSERAAIVMNRLKEQNPGFDGQHTATVREGEVRELKFSTNHVRDISALRALPYLWSLNMEAEQGRGQLRDLTSLTAHQELAALWLTHNPVDDLKPLEGKPIVTLLMNHTRVTDLAPLRLSPLTVIHFASVPITNLEPLRGKKLTEISCTTGLKPELDLTPIADAPLRRIWCDGPNLANTLILKAIPRLETINNRSAAERLLGR
ncbi:MAG: FecR domain-containing protein [Gemmataceae bacterium]